MFLFTALNDMAKGLEFLETGFIFHGEESPRRAYSYLANIYKSAGKAVPFKIPFDMVNYSTQQVLRMKITQKSIGSLLLSPCGFTVMKYCIT